MAFNTEEQNIINFGVKNGKSQQEVQQAVANFRAGIVKQPTPVQPQVAEAPKQSLFSPISTEFGGGEQGIAMKLKRDIQGGTDAYQQSLEGTKNPIVAGANLALAGGRVAGDVASAIYTPVAAGLNAATGGYLSKALDFVGKASQMGGKYNPINAVTDLKAVQDFVGANPQLEEDFGRALNIAMAGAETGKIEPSTVIPRTLEQFKSAGESISNVSTVIENKVQDVKNQVTDKFSSATQEAPANIMNRVARLKPTDEVNFTKLSGGKTPGEYLTETGNFGAPDKVIATEASKFKTSMESVDTELAKLPGVYKDGSITDALTGLLKKSQEVSGANVKAPYYQQVIDLVSKYNSGGLTMKDINLVKRLYERNVKLGYNKLVNGAQVEQATNIDSALRKWQVKQATDLGFTNIDALNKQTQLSRFLVNKLGDQLVGQAGLNGVSLTDWIVLSGGDASSIAGFLTKKFFSSKTVQAKVAEMLNQKDVKGLITPETSITPANIERRVSPQGLKQLPAGNLNEPQVQNNVAIQRTGASSIEPQATRSTNTTINPKTGDQYVRNTQTGKMEIIPSKKTPQQSQAKLNQSSPKTTTPKPTVKPVINSESPLLQEAKKYKSAEEFVKKQPVVYHGSATPLKKFNNKQGTFFTDDYMMADGYAGGENVYEGYLNLKKPLVIDAKGAKWDELKTPYGKSTQEIAGKLDTKKYDGIIFENIKDSWIDDVDYQDPGTIYYVAKTGDSFLNESQLTDIWKKANKK
jgi:hypothetical protein